MKRKQNKKGKFETVHRKQPIVPKPKDHVYPPPPVNFPPLFIAKNSILLESDSRDENDISAVFFWRFFWYTALFWFMSLWAKYLAPLLICRSLL